MKAGATYSDIKPNGMKGNLQQYWHGRVDSNYIANYIFVTIVALTGGDMTNAENLKVPGLEPAIYRDIKNKISTTELFGRTWESAMNEIRGIPIYTDKKKRWRQVLIYGLALHLATDAFAHSSYYKAADGTLKRYLHKGDDDNPNPDYDPNYAADHISCTENRWKCAYHTAGWVTFSCAVKEEGCVSDFSSYFYPCWKGFYMGNIYTYAKQADPQYDRKQLEIEFKSMNCKPPEE